MNSLEIKDKKQQLKEEVYNILETAKTEIRELTEEENNKIEEIRSQINNLNQELKTIEDELRKDESIPDELENTNNQSINTNKTQMEKNFSLLTAIRAISNNKALDNLSQAVVEAGAAEMRKAGLNYVGQIQLPCEARALTVTDEGEDVVATELMDIVRPLQAKNVMLQAGAKFLTGLVGDLQYPVMTAASCSWETETGDANDGSPTFTNIKLAPKRLAVVVPISKQFLIQDSVGAENAIREEIINAINAKLEATILGSVAGSATQPAGLFADTSNQVNVTDFKSLVDMEAGMEEANVYGDLKYILAPKAKSALRNMAKSTKSTQLVYEDGEVDGTTALCTSNVKNTNFVYGDFSQYVIAQWGNIDITVDNVTLAASGQIRLVVNCYFDAKPLRAAALKIGKITVA